MKYNPCKHFTGYVIRKKSELNSDSFLNICNSTCLWISIDDDQMTQTQTTEQLEYPGERGRLQHTHFTSFMETAWEGSWTLFICVSFVYFLHTQAGREPEVHTYTHTLTHVSPPPQHLICKIRWKCCMTGHYIFWFHEAPIDQTTDHLLVNCSCLCCLPVRCDLHVTYLSASTNTIQPEPSKGVINSASPAQAHRQISKVQDWRCSSAPACHVGTPFFGKDTVGTPFFGKDLTRTSSCISSSSNESQCLRTAKEGTPFSDKDPTSSSIENLPVTCPKKFIKFQLIQILWK